MGQKNDRLFLLFLFCVLSVLFISLSLCLVYFPLRMTPLRLVYFPMPSLRNFALASTFFFFCFSFPSSWYRYYHYYFFVLPLCCFFSSSFVALSLSFSLIFSLLFLPFFSLICVCSYSLLCVLVYTHVYAYACVYTCLSVRASCLVMKARCSRLRSARGLSSARQVMEEDERERERRKGPEKSSFLCR